MSEHPKPARWFLPSLDTLMGPLEPGTLTVVCGGSATGKSSLLANLRIGLGRQGVDAYVQEFDGGYLRREVTIVDGAPINSIQMDGSALGEIVSMPGTLTFCVHPNNMEMEIPRLLNRGGGVVIVDDVQRWTEGPTWSSLSPGGATQHALAWLKGLAERLNVAVVVGMTVRRGGPPAVRGEGGGSAYADAVLQLQRIDDSSRVSEATLVKHRTYPVGWTFLHFHPSGAVSEYDPLARNPVDFTPHKPISFSADTGMESTDQRESQHPTQTIASIAADAMHHIRYTAEDAMGKVMEYVGRADAQHVEIKIPGELIDLSNVEGWAAEGIADDGKDTLVFGELSIGDTFRIVGEDSGDAWMVKVGQNRARYPGDSVTRHINDLVEVERVTQEREDWKATRPQAEETTDSPWDVPYITGLLGRLTAAVHGVDPSKFTVAFRGGDHVRIGDMLRDAKNRAYQMREEIEQHARDKELLTWGVSQLVERIRPGTGDELYRRMQDTAGAMKVLSEAETVVLNAQKNLADYKAEVTRQREAVRETLAHFGVTYDDDPEFDPGTPEALAVLRDKLSAQMGAPAGYDRSTWPMLWTCFDALQDIRVEMGVPLTRPTLDVAADLGREAIQRIRAERDASTTRRLNDADAEMLAAYGSVLDALEIHSGDASTPEGAVQLKERALAAIKQLRVDASLEGRRELANIIMGKGWGFVAGDEASNVANLMRSMVDELAILYDAPLSRDRFKLVESVRETLVQAHGEVWRSRRYVARLAELLDVKWTAGDTAPTEQTRDAAFALLDKVQRAKRNGDAVGRVLTAILGEGWDDRPAPVDEAIRTVHDLKNTARSTDTGAGEQESPENVQREPETGPTSHVPPGTDADPSRAHAHEDPA